jgi:CDGSH-type Zn-finger protein
MSEPIIAQKEPYVMDMEPGTYHWCACGGSKKQPFCDGSHEGTDFSPMEVKLDEAGKKPWCGCKHTNTKPYCDGSHTKL